MSLDLEKFEKVITYFLEICHEPDEEKVIGENISPYPELKVIFEGFGYNEDTDEEDDENFESYAIFIHKDLDKDGFIFPEHESTAWSIVSRPDDEVCIHSQLDVNEEHFNLNFDLEHTLLTEDRVNELLKFLEKKYID